MCQTAGDIPKPAELVGETWVDSKLAKRFHHMLLHLVKRTRENVLGGARAKISAEWGRIELCQGTC